MSTHHIAINQRVVTRRSPGINLGFDESTQSYLVQGDDGIKGWYLQDDVVRESDVLADQVIIQRHAVKVRHRASIEIKVVRRVIQALLAADYELAVDDGDGRYKRNVNEREIIDIIFSVDVASIVARKSGGRASFVSLVLGNDGWDVVSDYGVSLEDTLAPVWKWIEEQEAAGV